MGQTGIEHAFDGSRSDKLTIAAFTLTACEVFLVYRNFRLDVGEVLPFVANVPFNSGLASVLVSLAACLVMLAAYLLYDKRMGHDRHLVAATICASVGPVVQFALVTVAHIHAATLPCIALTSIGCACFLPPSIQHVVAQGVQCSVRCSVSLCLALLVVAPASMLMPVAAHIVLLAVVPVLALACFRALPAVADSVPVAEEGRAHQKLPRVLMLTIVLGSLLEGAVAPAIELLMPPQGKFIVFSSAFIVSSVVLFVMLLRLRGSFNSALYRTCIPVMALGFALFVLGGTLWLEVGSFVFLVGRQLFAGTVLALVVFLARYHGSDYYLLTLGVAIGAMVGNLFGMGLSQQFGPLVPEPGIYPAPFIVFLLLFVLVSTLFLMNASNLRTNWGMVAVDDTQESVGLSFEQSCQELASRFGLTKREGELAALMARGKDKQSIAQKLFISEGTVKVHARNIYQKLDIHSRQELITLVEDIEKSIKE